MLDTIHRGYIEGYYGKLLSFEDRHGLLARLRQLSMDSYLYAPKDDLWHRFNWRAPYPDKWCAAFASFCETAKANQIQVLAGIAPGLDFNFAADKADFAALRAKAAQLTAAGADALVLMFDDISDDLSGFAAAGLSEGAAQAFLANKLQQETGRPLLLVPRLYADEIEGDHIAYAAELNQHLANDIAVFTCGRTIVAGHISLQNSAGILARDLQRRRLIWDNLYCNDYCPRRLFTGPWTGRQEDDPVLLNGTGLPETDRLLLGLMAGQDRQKLLVEAGVPAAFAEVEACFWHPVISGQPATTDPFDTAAMLAALDHLLWRWKSPLAREWYPYLFGLRQDLLLAGGEMEDERIAKTYTPVLARHLTATRNFSQKKG